MDNKPLNQSVRMAVVMGIFLPLAETVRRSNHILDISRFLNWFDDYILGGVLLLAAYLVLRKTANAITYLVTAWAFTAGALALSFLGQLDYFRTHTTDPGIFSTAFIAIAKGMIFVYLMVGLVLAIKANVIREKQLLQKGSQLSEG